MVYGDNSMNEDINNHDIWSESQGYMGTKVQVDRNLEERTWF
jgi:hypothetical protein